MRYLKFSSPLLLLMALVLFVATSCQKSTRELLIRKWQLLAIVDPDRDAMVARFRAENAVNHDPYIKKNLEEGEQINTALKARYHTTTVEYKADSTYVKVFLGGPPQKGKWSLSADGHLSMLNNPDSSGTEWITVTNKVEISEDTLVLIMEKNFGGEIKYIYVPFR